MHLIPYTSDYIGELAKIDENLGDITAKAQVRNSELAITGVLFYHNKRFLQVLEGSKNSLDKVMRVIRADKRHTNLNVLVDEPIPSRTFSDWTLDSFNLSNASTIELSELIKVRDLYRENLLIHGDMLVSFYKKMLSIPEDAIFGGQSNLPA